MTNEEKRELQEILDTYDAGEVKRHIREWLRRQEDRGFRNKIVNKDYVGEKL